MPLQEISNSAGLGIALPEQKGGQSIEDVITRKEERHESGGAEVRKATGAEGPQEYLVPLIGSATTTSCHDEPKPYKGETFMEELPKEDGASTWSCHLCNLHSIADADKHAISMMHKNRATCIMTNANIPSSANLGFLVPQYSKERGFKLCPYSWTCRLRPAAFSAGASVVVEETNQEDVDCKTESDGTPIVEMEDQRLVFVSRNEEDSNWSCSLCGIQNLQDHSVKPHCFGKRHSAAYQKLQHPSSLKEDELQVEKEKIKQERLYYDSEVQKLGIEDERFSFVRLDVTVSSWCCSLCNIKGLQASDITPHCTGKRHTVAFEAMQMIQQDESLIKNNLSLVSGEELTLSTSTPKTALSAPVDRVKNDTNEAESNAASDMDDTCNIPIKEDSNESACTDFDCDVSLEAYFASENNIKSTPTARRVSADFIKEMIGKAENKAAAYADGVELLPNQEEASERCVVHKDGEMSLEEFFLAPPTIGNYIPAMDENECITRSGNELSNEYYDSTFEELMGESLVHTLNEYKFDDDLKVFSDKLSREFDGMCDVVFDKAKQASCQKGKAKARLCIAELAFLNFD